jgi:hypothetical protein
MPRSHRAGSTGMGPNKEAIGNPFASFWGEKAL